MNTPLVSIIIPTYNRAHLIGETLDSVLAQTYTNWECIVVDDGSTDDTNKLLAAYCEKDARFQYHHRPTKRPKGANACRNYGFELSKGEYIQFFDSDDIIDYNILKSCVNVFKSNINLNFVFFNYLIFEKTISNIIIKQNNESDNPFIDYFSDKINLATPSILWSYKTIFNIRFNEYLYKSQELNFTFRLFTKYIDKPLNGFYLNENGFYLRKHKNSIVGFFHDLNHNYLLSDIIVRNQILKYFNKVDYINIQFNQRHNIKKSLSFYLYQSKIIDFVKILFKIYCPNKFLGIIKVKLLFYKIVFSFSKRDYRFKNAISLLYTEEFYLDFN